MMSDDPTNDASSNIIRQNSDKSIKEHSFSSLEYSKEKIVQYSPAAGNKPIDSESVSTTVSGISRLSLNDEPRKDSLQDPCNFELPSDESTQPESVLDFRGASAPPFQEQDGAQIELEGAKLTTYGSCKNCSEVFTDVTNITTKLLMEFEEVYKPLKKGQKYVYWCDLCKETIHRKEDRKSHMMKHISDNDISCESCVMGRQEPLSDEKKRHHQMKSISYNVERGKLEFEHNAVLGCSRTTVYCGQCGIPFSAADILLRELATVEILTPIEIMGEPRIKYICGACGEEENDESSLTNHILRHNEKKQFLCENCQKKEDKRFLCLHNGTIPKLSDNFGKTVQLDLPNPVQCAMCPNAIERPDLMPLMLMRMEVRPTHVYTCVVCSSEFFSRTEMDTHLNDHIRRQNTKYCDDCVEMVLALKER